MDDLLETLAKTSGLMYLSDLKRDSNREKIAKSIKNIDGFKYSLIQWRDLASYIFKENAHFEDSIAAKDYIINHLL